MTDLIKILKDLHQDTYIKADNIPSLALYMDQVTQLFEQTYHNSKRQPDEKILTKTMINNYAKGKLLPTIKNKKYTEAHIMLIQWIYQLKGALSIQDISHVLQLVTTIEERGEDLASIYQTYSALMDMQSSDFVKSLEQQTASIQGQLPNQDEQLETFLMIVSLIHYSNMYRKMAERLIDQTNVKQDSADH
ncbi:protein of unknown function [Amphibacillus marinus]|uniref:DUF1836 domain-containing protein n=1 Tax=Amphibacillus marinus TaxID=872970 RepID=A0A1H8MEZ4_9BACI|nr:DUF1836 domain-containing protein [Amphibacillus marinus]SEO15844.1 protein of unknown function [Amphibacillus marinus]